MLTSAHHVPIMCPSCAHLVHRGCLSECGEAREEEDPEEEEEEEGQEEEEVDIEGDVPITMRKYDPEHMHAVQYTIYCVVNFTVVCVSAHTVLLLPCDSFPYMPRAQYNSRPSAIFRAKR